MGSRASGIHKGQRADNRRSVRTPLLVLEVKGRHYNKIFIGYTENVSKDGFFLFGNHSLKAGDKFPVEFVLPDNVTTVNCTCEVIWTKQISSPSGNSTGLGVRFVDLDEPNKRVIDDWVTRAEDKNRK